MIFLFKDPLFSELLPAFFTNISCPGLLDSSVFEVIEIKNKVTQVNIKKIAELATQQYEAGLLLTGSYTFITNQWVLVCKLLRHFSIVDLIVFQLKLQVLPIIAPFLDLLGLFDNSPRIEYMGLTYSDFVLDGILNTYLILSNNSTAGLPENSIKHAAAFLNSLINY